jgi:hypothetical protein
VLSKDILEISFENLEFLLITLLFSFVRLDDDRHKSTLPTRIHLPVPVPIPILGSARHKCVLMSFVKVSNGTVTPNRQTI